MDATTNSPTTDKKISGRARRLQVASTVLMLLGFVDLIRGFMHTFNINYAAGNIAGVDLSAAMAPDFLVVMGGFGMANFLTGFLFILISRKAKELAPIILLAIPIAYFLGGVGLRLAGVQGEAKFSGQYMMIIYLGLSLVTALFYFLPVWFKRD